MTEHEDVFDNADDAMSRLQDKYDTLKREYVILYNALMGDLEESKRIKSHLIDRYQKDSNDIESRIQSIKNAKQRTLEE